MSVKEDVLFNLRNVRHQTLTLHKLYSPGRGHEENNKAHGRKESVVKYSRQAVQALLVALGALVFL